MKPLDPSRFDDVVGTPAEVQRIKDAAPAGFDSAARFWRAVFDAKHLTPRLKELILLALHASPPSLNETAIERHVQRAKAAGATDAEILDVLLAIIGVANHALYFAVPILLDEYQAAGREEDTQLPPFRPDIEALKKDFLATRGFWNEARDQLARLMPDYFTALSTMSMEPWKSGALSPKEREFVYIAIDCSIAHMHEPGIRIHIRNALRHGATRGELLELFQLSSLMGTESYVLGARALGRQGA